MKRFRKFQKFQILYALLLITCFIAFEVVQAQSSYSEGWKALDNGDLNAALAHFEKGAASASKASDAMLSAALIHQHTKNFVEAAQYLRKFYKTDPDPYPALFGLWSNEFVVGTGLPNDTYHKELLDLLSEDPKNVGKLDAETFYRLVVHYTLYYKNEKAKKHIAQIGALKDWSLLGPFDNVMQSGFNKNFGALEHSDADHEFTSQFGAKVKWFKPGKINDEGYVFKSMHFNSSSDIIYAQTFVDVSSDVSALLKLGYSGVLKLWVNDSLIYSESEIRNSGLDYFTFDLTLKEGANRILIQLGEVEDLTTSFCVRLTDKNYNLLNVKSSAFADQYNKGVSQVESIPYFGIAELEQKVANETEGLLYHFILVEAYKHNKTIDKAEALMAKMKAVAPKNFLVLRQDVLLGASAKNNTGQNQSYEYFKKLYPNDIDILNNTLEEEIELKNKDKARELIGQIIKLYPDPMRELELELELAKLEEDIERVIDLIDKKYKKYPSDFDAVSNKYEVLKSYKKQPEKANQLLATYLKNQYDYNILQALLSNYIEEGKYSLALEYLDKSLVLAPYDIDSYRSKVNIFSRQQNYSKAIEACLEVLQFRPNDYNVLEDLAYLNLFQGKKTEANNYFEQALAYYPFSYDINKTIMELKHEVLVNNLVKSIDVDSVIDSYEQSFVPQIKQPYDIVYDLKTVVMFNSSAVGEYRTYIARINDETGIDELKELTIGPDNGKYMYYKELKTIKQDGSKLAAERNRDEIVFVNLQVGDYVFLNYYSEQYQGGKSTLFNSDEMGMDSYYPIYYRQYDVLVQNGVELNYEVTNGSLPHEKEVGEHFTRYTWYVESPDVIPSQSIPVPYADIARVVHISNTRNWEDIVSWYSDLTTIQSTPDFTIKSITAELFDGKSHLSDLEKYEVIYNYIVEHVQYSYVDFRQSGNIPQKASKIYKSKLGDCKDMSTLYASIARQAGLKCNLVLINSATNGSKDVVKPSLNFNHCIVSIFPEGENAMYIELTDRNLPFGHLGYTHLGAAILEIDQNVNDAQLKYLRHNNNKYSGIERQTKVQIASDLQMEINSDVVRTGIAVSSFADNFYYNDIEAQRKSMKQSLQSVFKSPINLLAFNPIDIAPRVDSCKFSYSIGVSNDIQNVGMYRLVQVPFTDELAALSIFSDDERKTPFYFVKWEPYDFYKEQITFHAPEGYEFVEIPKNVTLSFNGSMYNLEFEQVSANEIKINRDYRVNRENVSPEQFEAFKQFISSMYEAEHTQLLFKEI